MLLHTFNTPEAFIQHRQRINIEDKVLFIEDGVYSSNQPLDFQCKRVMALAEDCQLRGIVPAESIQLIDYNDWVQLCSEVDNHLSWY
jgi:sulfur relay protein TusB/DsrH